MAFLCGECFRKDWSVIPFCRKAYVCNVVFTFPTDDCNLCICHNSDVFLQLTLECQEDRTDRRIVIKCVQQNIIPIGTEFVYAILVLYASTCRKPNLDAAFLLIFRHKKVELQLHYKRGITLLTCNF